MRCNDSRERLGRIEPFEYRLSSFKSAVAVIAILPHFHSEKHPHPLAVLTPLLVLAVPLGDLAWVVILRTRMGKPFYVGDTNHLSHRLVRAGLNRTTAVLLIWLAAVLIGGLALL